MEDNKIPRPLEIFLVIIIGFFITIIFTQVLVLLLVPAPDDLQKNSLMLKILITVGEIGLFIVPVVYLRMKQYPMQPLFRWNKVPSEILLVSVPLGFAISIIGDEFDRLVSMVIPAPELLSEITESLKINSSSEFVFMVFGAVVVAALVEESLIRGLLQISMEKYQNVTRAVIYSSLAWTAIHGIIYWALQIFLLGIILGYLAWRSNSVIPSIICHAINNALALFFYNVAVSKYIPMYEWKGHVSPLILIPAILILVYGIRYFDGYYRALKNQEAG